MAIWNSSSSSSHTCRRLGVGGRGRDNYDEDGGRGRVRGRDMIRDRVRVDSPRRVQTTAHRRHRATRRSSAHGRSRSPCGTPRCLVGVRVRVRARVRARVRVRVRARVRVRFRVRVRVTAPQLQLE